MKKKKQPVVGIGECQTCKMVRPNVVSYSPDEIKGICLKCMGATQGSRGIKEK